MNLSGICHRRIVVYRLALIDMERKMFDIGRKEPVDRFLDLVDFPAGPPTFDPRPVRRFRPSWMYCSLQNCSDEPLFIYGPRHDTEDNTVPTSLFMLHPLERTPKGWDCKGLLIPSGCLAFNGASTITGPSVLKYRDLRRVKIRLIDGYYQCPKSNGILHPGQLDYTVPNVSHEELLSFPRRRVRV
jgi:hypothetical protein